MRLKALGNSYNDSKSKRSEQLRSAAIHRSAHDRRAQQSLPADSLAFASLRQARGGSVAFGVRVFTELANYAQVA
jgi:hypothetical protein